MPLESTSLLPALVWAQNVPNSLGSVLMWLYVWGEPAVTLAGTPGGILTWVKVVGLFCLLGWLGGWLITALKERPTAARRAGPSVLDVLLLIGLAAGLVSALLLVLVANKRLPANLNWTPTAFGLTGGVLALLWAEARLWSILGRRGTRGDRLTLVGVHLALLAGIAVAGGIHALGAPMIPTWRDALYYGSRLGATYMGLIVLIRIASKVLPEVSAIRWRRIYAIAWQSWTESFRRMWAPWVVIVVFAVILAFTSWFLDPGQRAAELGRLYVGTLMLLSSILLTLLVVILAPISLPNDVRQQTIYTVVSKPVRRLELIWGRMVGYMALVSVLLLFFGGVSLIYYNRMVGAAIREADSRYRQAVLENKREFAQQFRDQAEQLRTRRKARVPVTGSLIFFDSRNNQKRSGIDVGMELPLRSFVEGATPSRAVWRFGPHVQNPRNENEFLNVPIPVDSLLKPGTIEYVENQMYEFRDEAAIAQRAREASDLKTADIKALTERAGEAEAAAKRLEAQLATMRRQEQALRAQGKTKEAEALHSPPLKIEMTFTVYRTTKGDIGEPVFASLVATNQRRPEIMPHRDVLPIREYYTNKRTIPSRILVGSGGEVNIEVKCLSTNQYLGMANNDLIVLSSEGSFEWNFLRGLFGVWLQALVLTAIGVCAGSFLSWPVALLTTIFFFVAGNVGFTALQQFALSAEMVGGGPFESLIRMLSHDNLVTELAPTVAVVVAKTLDSIVMPVMSRLVYLVPNFTALDVSNTVAEGFSVSWAVLAAHTLLAVAYALPFSIAAYFILRRREVAA
jgi:hypothetical protein